MAPTAKRVFDPDKVKLGDAEHFELFYEVTSGLLFGLALKAMRDRSVAEDCLQTVYVRFFNLAREGRLSEVRNLTAYIIRMLHRYCIDVLRRQNLERNLFVFEDEEEVGEGKVVRLPSRAPSPQEILEREDAVSAIRSVLSGISYDHYLIFALSVGADAQECLLPGTGLEPVTTGMANKDIADLLGIQETTVRTSLHRTRKRIRAGLKAISCQGTRSERLPGIERGGDDIGQARN